MTLEPFIIDRIAGIDPKRLSTSYSHDYTPTITLKVEQVVAGSAWLKIAGQCIAIHVAYPDAVVVVDITEATAITGDVTVLNNLFHQISFLNIGQSCVRFRLKM